jgi:hypothetical protein
MARRREIVRATPHDQRDHWFVVGMVSRGAMRLRETHAKKDCALTPAMGWWPAYLGTDAAAISVNRWRRIEVVEVFHGDAR